MASIEQIKGSDGSGNANVATVTNTRAPLASTILVDTVLNINAAGFKGTMGTPHTFVDPISGETITVISEDTAVDFSGHVDGSNLEIDDIAPGYTDNGSEVGDIIIIRPTTDYANNLADVLSATFDDDGTIKDNAISSADMFADAVDPVKRATETVYDYVASGVVITADNAGTNKNYSASSGVAYLAGKRLTVAAVSAQTVGASKDRYIYLRDNGDGTAVHVTNEVSNNAASPALLQAGDMLIGIVVAGATTIATAASINQGQEDRVLPIASSIAYTVTDSIGNLICPRDPQRRLLGFRRRTTDFTTTSSTTNQVTGLSCPVLPTSTTGKIKVAAGANGKNATDGIGIAWSIWDGTVNSGTKVAGADIDAPGAGYKATLYCENIITPGVTTVKTYNVGTNSGNNAATTTILGASTAPSWIRVERE